MNEETQLKAMAAELTAAGYKVRTDVVGDQLDTGAARLARLEGIRLDIVAELVRPDGPDDENPDLLVIEIANRRRPAEDRIPAGRRAMPRYVEDEEALKRFEMISEALADVPRAEFQIRFLDVSADQATARQLKGPLKSKDAMLKRLTEDRSALVRSAGRDDLSRALVVARLWSSWLRIVGKLHPGSERRELKDADLRTIQKDLFDQQIIDLRPGRYAVIHRSLMAVVEGGDVDLRDLTELQPQVWRLLDWATDRYGVPRLEIEAGPDSLIGRLRQQIAEITDGERREALDVALATLWLTEGSSAFPRMVTEFLLALRHTPLVDDDLITELLERAASSPA
jgi:hypothetical protein